MGWCKKLNPRLNHYYYRLCDQRIPRLKEVWASYIGKVLQCHHDVHNHHDPLTFGSDSEAEMSTLLKYLNGDMHRIKKSQAQNCDTCSELKRKCSATARIICTNYDLTDKTCCKVHLTSIKYSKGTCM